MVRTSRTRRRSLPGFEFDSAMRDMRRDRVELTPEQRQQAIEKRVKEALAAANKRRLNLPKIGG